MRPPSFPMRMLVIVLVAVFMAAAAAQTSAVEELALALRSDAMGLEEPLGIEVGCEPYLATFPGMDLSCFALTMPPTTMLGLFAEYIGSHEVLAWTGEWEAMDEIPADLDPEDEHMRRGIESTTGRSYVLAILEVGYFRHIVVASAPE